MKNLFFGMAIMALFLLSPGSAVASIITFDDIVSGVTSYSYDGDGDSIDDVVFSTTDPLGFNTVGPGTEMTYIDEPGIEGTRDLTPDLRVDFYNGAVNSLGFGFATSFPDPLAAYVTFNVFDANDALIASSGDVYGNYTTLSGGGQSSFPEAYVSVSFSGVASYATFDFNPADDGRYIIDNFAGTFGSTEDITPSAVPEPTTMLLFGIGLLGFARVSRSKK